MQNRELLIVPETVEAPVLGNTDFPKEAASTKRHMEQRDVKIVLASKIYRHYAEWNRKQNSPKNIIINLLKGDFPVEEIKYLYVLRWGIEPSFCTLNHAVGAINRHA